MISLHDRRQKLLLDDFFSQRTPSLGAQYAASVLATSPIAYLKMNEGTGQALADSSGNGRSATGTGLTWDSTLSPYSEPAPFLDGTNDVVNWFSASLAGAFSLDVGTLLIWFKVHAASVWTDGVARHLCEFQMNSQNRLFIRKQTTNNTLNFTRIGANTGSSVNATISPTGWASAMLSWRLSPTPIVRCRINGTQTGSDQTNGVAAAGAITLAVLGSNSTVPGNVWHGYEAQVALWNTFENASIVALGVPAA